MKGFSSSRDHAPSTCAAMSPSASTGQDQAFAASVDPYGKPCILYRGTWLPRSSAEGLLRRFEADARDPSDWFHQHAYTLARELRRALEEAFPERIAA